MFLVTLNCSLYSKVIILCSSIKFLLKLDGVDSTFKSRARMMLLKPL